MVDFLLDWTAWCEWDYIWWLYTYLFDLSDREYKLWKLNLEINSQTKSNHRGNAADKRESWPDLL